MPGDHCVMKIIGNLWSNERIPKIPLTEINKSKLLRIFGNNESCFRCKFCTEVLMRKLTLPDSSFAVNNFTASTN